MYALKYLLIRVMLMKNKIKRFLCFALCLAVAFSSAGVAAFGVSDYPEGVNAQQALNAVGGTDKLLNKALPALTGKNLSQLVKPVIYSDETMSGLLLSLYSSLGANASELEMIGLSASPEDVAGGLEDYPQVKEALLKADSWESVDLNGVKWGITDKNSLAVALGKALSPFNDLLYMLLCSGEYKISGFIKLQGDDGYSNMLVPLLSALKCEGIMSSAEFKAQADSDKASMVKNIALPVLELLEKALTAPFDTLTEVLPSFAYFSESGEMDKCMDDLLSPVTSNPLVEIAVFLKIIDLDALSLDMNSMLSEGIGQLAGQSGFKLAPLDMAALSKCGSHNGMEFVSDKGKAYVAVMRWLVASLKENPDALSALGGEGAGDIFSGILSKDTDSVVKAIILIFDPTAPSAAQAMVYPAITAVSVPLTPNLTEDNLQKVLKEIDPLLDDFVKEGGSYRSVESLLSSAIYSNSNVTALAKGIYGALEKEGMGDMLVLLGIDISPEGVAEYLQGYSSAAALLRKAESWDKVSEKSLSWGFYNGSRRGFENALAAVLRPLYPVLRVILAGEDMTIMDSITIKGADGYNTAVIPLLEALGCESRSIKTYSEYLKDAHSDKLIKAVTEPVFDLLDDVFEKPVYTLTGKLPNIVYFLNSGSFEKCIQNLLLPVTALTDKLSGVIDMNMDMSGLTKLDLNSLLGTMLEGSGMKIAEFDFNSLAGMGTLTQKTSKSTLSGKAVTYSYVEADRIDVLMSLLRVLAKTLKMPGNENLLTGSMGGGNEAFSAYSSSIGEQFAAMTEDELIEWLYNLLFKERAKIEIVVDEDYSPTIIYKETPKDYTALYAVGGFGAFALIVLAVMYFNRKKLYY